MKTEKQPDNTEAGIVMRCLPHLRGGPLSTLELRARIKGDTLHPSEVYRACANDERIEVITWGGVTAYRARSNVGARA